MKKNNKDLIIGISAFDNDSSASILKDGIILAAAQEERFTRIKNDASFPSNAIKYCLKEAKADIANIHTVVFHKRPLTDFKPVLENFYAAPKNISSSLKQIVSCYRKHRYVKNKIKDHFCAGTKIIFEKNMSALAASAFFPSPFKEAGLLIIDSSGETETTGLGIGRKNKIKIFKKNHFPHSIKHLYSAFTEFCGFRQNSGEYKLMGLAPYGNNIYEDLIFKKIVNIKKHGSFKINLSFFDISSSRLLPNDKFAEIFGIGPRNDGPEIAQVYMDIAASIQSATEKMILILARYLKKRTKCENICLSGDLALNCAVNGKLLKSRIFENIWIQPSPTNSGAALGSAILHWSKNRKTDGIIKNSKDLMKGSLLGPSYTDNDIEYYLKTVGAAYEKIPQYTLFERAADLIAEGNIIGWFQGRMEFGPRALGSRSILADPRRKEMRDLINHRIKLRESFRPLAPSIIEEKTKEFFDLKKRSPYMLLVVPVKKGKRCDINLNDYQGLSKKEPCLSVIPAVTHVDFSSRVQTVNECDNKLYYELIRTFSEKYGCPIVINTSFNMRNEPIVCSPKDAYECFTRSGLDRLIIGNFIVKKDYPYQKG